MVVISLNRLLFCLLQELLMACPGFCWHFRCSPALWAGGTLLCSPGCTDLSPPLSQERYSVCYWSFPDFRGKERFQTSKSSTGIIGRQMLFWNMSLRGEDSSRSLNEGLKTREEIVAYVNTQLRTGQKEGKFPTSILIALQERWSMTSHWLLGYAKENSCVIGTTQKRNKMYPRRIFNHTNT